MYLARRYYRLLAYDPLSGYFSIISLGIEYFPISADELYRVITQMFNADMISKHKMFTVRIRILRLIASFNRDFYAFCNLCDHWMMFIVATNTYAKLLIMSLKFEILTI